MKGINKLIIYFLSHKVTWMYELTCNTLSNLLRDEWYASSDWAQSPLGQILEFWTVKMHLFTMMTVYGSI